VSRFGPSTRFTWPAPCYAKKELSHRERIKSLVGPALLGAVTLEEFALSVDPVARRLVPVRSYLT